jgi:hypothetical protein
MKKILSFMIFTALLVTGLHGQIFPLSAGAGSLLGYTFTRYTMEAKAGSNGQMISVQTMDRFDYGGFLFFDATYAEFAVSIRGGQNAYRETMDTQYEDRPWTTVTDDKGTGSEVMIGFSLLGKYPFRVTEKITWFPLVGVGYQIATLEQRTPQGDIVHDRTAGELPADLDKDGNPFALWAWNCFTIDLGAGFDYQLRGRLFLRNELIFSFRLQTPYETGALEMTKEKFRASDVSVGGLTGGPALRTSVGYRLSDKK